MNTPIVDFVNKYKAAEGIRFHMPGHKGGGPLGFEGFDITEIFGADSLYEAAGIIAESEANANSLFGFGRTLYSTGGASQCVKAMLYLTLLSESAKGNGSREVIADRHSHRSFHHACALLDLAPHWIYPEGGGFTDICPAGAGELSKVLAGKEKKPLAVYITFPTYQGTIPDIAAISRVCGSFGLPLLVDNAHGAYLKFLEPSRHPVDLGAFMSADSAHKTLPVLTGGAYLQLSSRVQANVAAAAKEALSMFGSSSPSYLTLASLDACNRYIAQGYRERLAAFAGLVEGKKKRLADAGWPTAGSDPLRIVLDTAAAGYSGAEVAEALRVRGIECEYAGADSLVLMLTPENTPGQLDYFCACMEALPPRLTGRADGDIGSVGGKKEPPSGRLFIRNERLMSLREAYFSPSEQVPAARAAGRICARPPAACPPAIPVVVGGELISRDCAELLVSYGIEYVEVVAGVSADV